MEIKNKNFLIYGSGVSGISAYNFLKQKGANVYIFCDREKETIKHLNNVPNFSGIDTLNIDYAIISPGVQIIGNKNIKKLKQKGIMLLSELELGYMFCKGKFVAVTGTNGKTTTKELVKAVLSKKYRTHATVGNLNNHIGVPLTLLSMPQDTEIAIIEMGANHPGEIDFLCNIALPDYGLVTNVGKAHLEGFGSFEGVVQTKTEMYRFVEGRAGMLFVNADNEILLEKSEGIKRMLYGKSEQSNAKGAYRSANPYMKFYFENGDVVYSVDTNLMGGYNFDNAMAAVCVGSYFNVDLFDIKMALEEYEPTNKRSQMKKTDRNVLLLDCYNANPSSMKVAIENFGNMNVEGNKVVVLGEMKELGVDSELEHKQVLEQLRNYTFANKVFVGGGFSFVQQEADCMWFANIEEAKEYFKNNPISNATILLKGSNSVRVGALEEIL